MKRISLVDISTSFLGTEIKNKMIISYRVKLGFDVRQLRQFYNEVKFITNSKVVKEACKDVSLCNLMMTTNNEFYIPLLSEHSIMVNCYQIEPQCYQINLIMDLMD